jgi:Na+-transporting methylmalonyl-CoA/oxaloacetate decarboxylase gamma subunit
LELLPKALLITVIGMGLVFVAIFILWGLMALLVKLTTEAEDDNAGKEDETEMAVLDDAPSSGAPDPVKVRAAAAAVATALALAAGAARRLQPETDPASSPWKEAHRTLEINRRSGCFNR